MDGFPRLPASQYETGTATHDRRGNGALGSYALSGTTSSSTRQMEARGGAIAMRDECERQAVGEMWQIGYFEPGRHF